jgi:hypothetical protein
VTLPVPNLDDRTWAQLVAEARQRARETCETWNDLSAHDPGVVLLEVFAYLTETMLYRLNRVPEKAYVEFLNLIGMQRRGPAAAVAELTIQHTANARKDLTIPRGTKVTVDGSPAGAVPVFTTAAEVKLPRGEDQVTVIAHHCDRVEGELLGTGSGTGRQAFRVQLGPITRTGDDDDLVIGLSVDGRRRGAETFLYEGTTYERWHGVDSFADVAPDEPAYVVDPASGLIVFGPSPEGVRVPNAGQEIRAWYRTGGGAAGNVAAGTLTKWGIGAATVINLAPAKGGADLESLDNALVRGPQEFFTLQRAVTARDFELLAVRASAATSRARALTRATTWCFGQPGEVEVQLVPAVTVPARARLTMADVIAEQTTPGLDEVRAELDRRRPLGTTCIVDWARLKEVSVRTSLVVRREEDVDAVRERVLDRLYQTLTPVPSALNPDGWPFGGAVRASNLYRMIEEAEPGVQFVEDLSFELAAAPDKAVRALTCDAYQASTWYVASGPQLFRSLNDGDGWELMVAFEGEAIRAIAPYPKPARPGLVSRPGWVAAAVALAGGTGAEVHVSEDLGSTWTKLHGFTFPVGDLAWIERDGVAILLMATDQGLFELPLLAGATPEPTQIVVEPQDAALGFYSVAAVNSERGKPCVALAAQEQKGVYLSEGGGETGSYQPVTGLAGIDIRALAIQVVDTATYLWACIGEPDREASGSGCQRVRLFEGGTPQWEAFDAGWHGGTCWDVAFANGTAYAASQSGGVLLLDTTTDVATWSVPDVNCGLPNRDRQRFDPVLSVAASASSSTIMVGAAEGIWRSTDEAQHYDPVSARTSDRWVTVPDTWVLCSGEHQVDVRAQGAARRD